VFVNTATAAALLVLALLPHIEALCETIATITTAILQYTVQSAAMVSCSCGVYESLTLCLSEPVRLLYIASISSAKAFLA
jgi:hypothetical protein